jgi:hypothetical protein
LFTSLKQTSKVTVKEAVGDGSTGDIVSALPVDGVRVALLVGRRLQVTQQLPVVARPQIGAVVLEVVSKAVVELETMQQVLTI